MRNILLLLFFFCTSLHGVDVKMSLSVENIHPGETREALLEMRYDVKKEPLISEFFLRLERELPTQGWRLSSYKIQKKEAGFLQLAFNIQPRRTGELSFTPRFFLFMTDGKIEQVAILPQVIQCIRRFPPFRPKGLLKLDVTALQLTEKNRSMSFEERGQKEVRYYHALREQRKRYLLLMLFSVAFIGLFLVGFVLYKEYRKKRKKEKGLSFNPEKEMRGYQGTLKEELVFLEELLKRTLEEVYQHPFVCKTKEEIKELYPEVSPHTLSLLYESEESMYGNASPVQEDLVQRFKETISSLWASRIG